MFAFGLKIVSIVSAFIAVLNGQGEIRAMKCDLCRIADAVPTISSTILCIPCSESISRLISIEHWMKHRIEDDMRNRLQEQMLVAYVAENKSVNTEHENKILDAE